MLAWSVLGASTVALGALLVLAWRHRATGRPSPGADTKKALLALPIVGMFVAVGVAAAIAAGYVDLPPGLSEQHREYLANSKYNWLPTYDDPSRDRSYYRGVGCVAEQFESFGDAMANADVVFSGTVVGYEDSFVLIVPDATWKGPKAPEYVRYDGTNMGPMWIAAGRDASSSTPRGAGGYSWYEGEQYLVFGPLFDPDDPRFINHVLVWWDSRTSPTTCATRDLLRLRLLWGSGRWPFLMSCMLVLSGMVSLAWRHRARGPTIGG